MTTTRPIESSRHEGYAFGPFVVDSVRRRLWRDGRLVPITAKPLHVLVVLLEHRDRVVSKDELLNRVWPDTTVQENNLARQISALRRALGQRPDQHDYVVTIPGQGYRFVARVHELRDLPSDQQPGGDISSPPPRGAVIHLVGSPGGHEPVAGESMPVADGDGGRRPESVGPGRPWTAIGLLVAATCAVLAAAVAVSLLRPRDRPEPQRALQRITYEEAVLPRDASWAPDATRVVYASDRAGNADLWTQRLGDPDPMRLTASEAGESQPEWSPDGRWIVFRSERDGGGLYVMPAGGGAERMVSSFGYEPLWSPDSTRILFKRSVVIPDLPTIHVAGLDGKPPRPVRPDVLGQFRSVNAAWHPDGRRVSLWGTIGKDTMRFLTVSLEGGGATIPEVAADVQRNLANVSPGRFVWARSRRFIYFEGQAGDTRNVWRVTVDPATETWTDGPERLTTGAGEETNLSLSSDGTKLLFTATSTRTRLWAFPLDSASGRLTGPPAPITDGSTGEVDFDARADGAKVAYHTVRAGRSELRERTIAEGRERLLLSSPDWRFTKPRWSPDGARLAFSRYATRDHSVAVAVLNTDGTGERVLTTPSEVEMQAYDWSRDGQHILGSCRFRQSHRYATCLVPVGDAELAGSPDVRVIASDPQRNLYNQRFSPDQRWITFLAHDLSYASISTVYVIPAAGGSWRAITEGAWFDDKPRWGPDGQILYFVSNRTGVANVWARRFDPRSGSPRGEPFPVTSFRSARFALTPRTVQMDIAVTATHLLLPMSEARSELWMLDHVDR